MSLKLAQGCIYEDNESREVLAISLAAGGRLCMAGRAVDKDKFGRQPTLGRNSISTVSADRS